METVTSADGTPIAYERTGSGPPLVLVHGAADDHTLWELVRPLFEEYFTVIAIDRRGRGQSGGADEYTLEREIEDVTAVVDSFDEPVTLVGHSSGALCSLEASLRTDNLRDLVLYEPALEVSEDRITEMKTLVENGKNKQAIEFFMQGDLLPPEQVEELRSSPAGPVKDSAAPLILQDMQEIADYRFDAERFADMSTSTLLLVGSESPTGFHRTATAISEALPDCQITELNGEYHVAMVTAPESFATEVLSFVTHAD